LYSPTALSMSMRDTSAAHTPSGSSMTPTRPSSVRGRLPMLLFLRPPPPPPLVEETSLLLEEPDIESRAARRARSSCCPVV
jgi:hypothetical protein